MSKRLFVVTTEEDATEIRRRFGQDVATHVIGGLISPIEGVGPDALKIASIPRDADEYVLAIEGDASHWLEVDATLMYVGEHLPPTASFSRLRLR